MSDRELLHRAWEIIRSAYATAEWLRGSRTKRTDETFFAILDVVEQDREREKRVLMLRGPEEE